MKRTYIKPQSKEIVVKLLGSILNDNIGFANNSRGAFRLDSRRANLINENEEEGSMWDPLW